MELQPSSSQCVHVAFADHYVTITSNLAYDALSLAASMAPMLVSEPSGTCAGCLQAFASGNRFAIKGTDRPDCEYFEDAEEGVRALHHRVVKLLLDARPDLLFIHAAVVASGSGAIVLAAPSGQGKSTMVAEFLALGWLYLSDEIAAIDPATRQVVPFPLSPHKRIGPESSLSPEEVCTLQKVSIDVSAAAIGVDRQPIQAICFLRYSPGSHAARLLPCPPGTAVIELLKNSLNDLLARELEIAKLCSIVRGTVSFYMDYFSASDGARELSHRVRSIGRALQL